MATTTTPASKKYVEFDEFIDFQLRKTRAGIKTNDILTALAGVATLFLAYVLIFVVFDHWIVNGGFSPIGRWLMLGGLLVACAAWIVWRVVIPSRKQVTGLYAARAIETTEPGLKHTLLNLVDLRRSGRAIPEDISRAMEKRAAITLSKTDVDSAVDRRPLMRLSYGLLALVVLVCLYSLFSPKKISASVWRALFPAAATEVDTAIKIDKVAVEHQGRLHDADVTVPARSKLDVIVDLSYAGAAPEQVMLYYSTADDKYRDVPVPLRPDAKEPKRYRVRLSGESNRGILQNTTYRIEAGDAKAGPFTITVVRPPIATVKQVRYVYPKYMEREPKMQDGGHIETWEGTAVTVSAKTDQPVTEAWLVFTDTEDIAKPAAKVRMTIAGGTGLSVQLKREIAFREDGSYPRFYHIECMGKNGIKDPRPAIYGVTIRRDLPPEIQLLDPRENERDVPANTKILPLLFKARDPDFKLRMVTLRAELTRAGKADGEPEKFDEQIFEGHERKIQKSYDWNLERMRLKAGDTVKFRLEARDNKEPSGNRTFTRWVTLRIVAPVDKNQAEQQLKNDRDRQKQMQQEQDKNDGDQNAGEQPQDQNKNGNDAKKPQPKDGDKGKKQQGKGKSAAKQGAGDNGAPKTDKKGKSKTGADQPQDGAQDGNGEKQNPNAQSKTGGDEKPPKNDEDLIKQALKDQQQNPRKNGKQQGKTDPKGDKPDGTKPDKGKQNPENGTDPNGVKKSSPKKQQPGEGTDPKTGKTPAGKMPPMPKQQGNDTPGQKQQPPPKPKTDGPEKKADGQQKKDDGDGMGANGQKTDGKKTDGKKDGSKKTPNGGSKGMPSPKQDPGMTDDGTGNSGAKSSPKKKDPQAGSGEPKSKSKGNDGGPRENVSDKGKKKATPKKADGSETGDADPNKNPNADPTRAKSPEKIKRREGTEPVKKKSTTGGDPKEPGMKSGSKNPDKVKSETSKKDGATNPDERPTEPKENPGSKIAKKSNDQQDPGNQKQRGKGRKNGQKSTKSDGGEDGMGRTSDQGMKGGKQKGSGDDTNRKGRQNDAAGKKTGNAGKKSGPGSQVKPGGKSGGNPGGKSSPKDGGKAGDPSKAPPMGAQGGNTPGNSGDTMNKLPNRKQNARDNGGAGNGNARQGADPAGDDADPEKADLNHGKKASNLVLNNLEDKVKRGDVDKEWLKKHGWTSREQALKEIARIRKRVNGDSDPQFNEFLKSIRDIKFQSQAGKRDGRNVRKKVIKGEGNTDSENVPPHLRNYYRAFQRSVK